MLVLFIISRRVMKSSKAKSITGVLQEARAALQPTSTRQGLQMRTLSLGTAAGPLPAGRDTCPPLPSTELFCQPMGWPCPKPLVCDGAI